MTSSKSSIEFFKEYAGYSVAPGETQDQGRTRSAEILAKAEAYAEEHDWHVEWSYDEESCSGCECGSDECNCFTGKPHETLGAVLYDSDIQPDAIGANAHVLGSLWGICEPSREYRRVINAELASEALAELQAKIESVV